MKQILIIIMVILVAGLLLNLSDKSHAEYHTFTVKDKYTRLECAILICIEKTITYYIVTSDNKTYRTFQESYYDSLHIGETITAKITPNYGYIISVEESKSVQQSKIISIVDISITVNKLIKDNPALFLLILFIPMFIAFLRYTRQ